MSLINISLDDLRWWCEEYVLERTGRAVRIVVHYTTELEKVKANVQGDTVSEEYDIVIAGGLRWKSIVEAMAHEVAHIVLPKELGHGVVWEKEKKKIKEYLEQKVAKGDK